MLRDRFKCVHAPASVPRGSLSSVVYRTVLLSLGERYNLKIYISTAENHKGASLIVRASFRFPIFRIQ